jgi:hypothetical protein
MFSLSRPITATPLLLLQLQQFLPALRDLMNKMFLPFLVLLLALVGYLPVDLFPFALTFLLVDKLIALDGILLVGEASLGLTGIGDVSGIKVVRHV